MRRPFAALPVALPLALLVAVLLTQTGCLLHAREIARTKRALEAEYPEVRFKKKTMLNLGPLSLWLAGGLMRLTAGPQYARVRPYLRYLHRVQLGVYETQGRVTPAPLAPSTLPFLRKENWRVAVSTRHSGEHVWVLYRRPARQGVPLRDLYLLTLNDDELVAVRLRGQIDRLVQRFLEKEDVLDRLLGRRSDDAAAPAEQHAAPTDSSRTARTW